MFTDLDYPFPSNAKPTPEGHHNWSIWCPEVLWHVWKAFWPPELWPLKTSFWRTWGFRTMDSDSDRSWLAVMKRLRLSLFGIRSRWVPKENQNYIHFVLVFFNSLDVQLYCTLKSIWFLHTVCSRTSKFCSSSIQFNCRSTFWLMNIILFLISKVTDKNNFLNLVFPGVSKVLIQLYSKDKKTKLS